MKQAPLISAAPRSPRRHTIAIGLLAFVVISGLLIPLVASGDLSSAFIPLAIAGILLLLWNGHWGLCLAAFAIAPLGAVQRSFLGLTLNLPEVLILALVAKEAYRFIIRKEQVVRCMPVGALIFHVCALLTAIATGLAFRNGAISVLQDFRQFTEFILLFLLVLQRVKTRQQAIHVASCYVLGATLVSIHGIVQHYIPFDIEATQIASDLFLYNKVRSGSFYGATTLGGLMVLAVGPAVGLALVAKDRFAKIVMATCIGLCLVAAVFTMTRASWAGLLVSFAFVFLSLRPSLKVVAATAAGTAIFAMALGPSIVQRVSALDASRYNSSIMSRAEYYTAAFHIIRANPMFGLGWGCYYDRDNILVNERYVTTPRPPGASDVTVHSAYLQIFVKAGVFGLLSFVAILAAWAERIWRARKSKPPDKRDYALFVGITAGLVGYLFHGTFENFFQWPVMSQSFWLLLGLSFRMSDRYDSEEPLYRVRFAFAGVFVTIFSLFMYGSVWIEASGPYHFQKNVANALAENDLPQALKFARNATRARPNDPMAHTVYGQVLFENGEADEAFDRLATALGKRTRNGYVSWDTGAQYYFASARLVLGKYYFDRDMPLDAVANFELARGSVVPESLDYSDFRAALYEAYAKQKLWGRALQFGEPSDRELDDLDSREIMRIARIYEGERNWILVTRLAKRLLIHEAFVAEAHYLLGRVALSQHQREASLERLARAVSMGHPHAAFFLGTAHEMNHQPARAIEAYVRTSPGDLYRSFALAKAAALLDSSTEEDRINSTLTPQDFLDLLDREIVALRSLPRPVSYDESHPLAPIAVVTSQDHFAAGGRFPLLILWQDKERPAADSAAMSFSGSESDDSLLIFRGSDTIVQLQWVENLVYWDSVETLRAGAGTVPGWIDTARDWFGLQTGHAAVIRSDGTGNSFLDITRLAWFYSVPIRVQDGAGYLAAGRMRAPQGKASLTWQALDEEGSVVSENEVGSEKGTDAWTWQGGYMRSRPDWVSMRVQLNVMRHAGTVSFDNVMLVEIEEPNRTISNAGL